MKDEPNILSMFGSSGGHHNTELRKRDITLDKMKTTHHTKNRGRTRVPFIPTRI